MERALTGLFKSTTFAVTLVALLVLSVAVNLVFLPAALLLPEWRLPGRIQTQLVHRYCAFLVTILGIRIHVNDARSPEARSDSRRTLYVANHIGYLDVIAISSVLPTKFLAKAQIQSWPLVGAVVRAVGCLFVDRDTLTGRVQALFMLKRHLRQESVCIFPEGTTTDKAYPSAHHWKPGSLWSVAPEKNSHMTNRVVAVGLSYSQLDSVAWIDDMEFLPHLWRLLQRRRVDVYLNIKEVCLDSDEFRDIRSLGARLYQTVSDLCGRASAEGQPNRAIECATRGVTGGLLARPAEFFSRSSQDAVPVE